MVAALLAPAGANAAAPGDHAGTAAQSSRRVLFVAPTGDDSASGSLGHPLATIQTAVGRLPSGGVVELRGGTYAQRVMLHNVAGVTIEAYHHEHAILDGSSLTPPADTSAMIEINNSRRITIAGLDIFGYATKTLNIVPIGIYLHGGSSHVTVRNNHVHDMGNYNGTLGSFDLNAHGIAAYGDDPHHPISGLTIARNEVDHLALGASESVVVNGNVDGWRIVNNRIHDNNNIGIDAIGFEPTLHGKYRYTMANRARNGLIGGNDIWNIISAGNPAYWEGDGWCNCADGIYIDGGTHITVGRNVVGTSDIGIEVAAENPRGNASHVVVRSNFIHDSKFTGLTTGGYCNGASDCGGVKTGSSFDNTFVNNTLYHNNTLNDGSPEMLIQYYAYHDRWENNIVYAANDDHVLLGTVPDAQSDGLSTRNVIDHNIYYTSTGDPSTGMWGSLGQNYTGWDAYRQATGLDQHSQFINPDLQDLAVRNLHLSADSPAVNAGAWLPPSVVGSRDVDGQPRVQGGRIDIGADERS